MKSDRCVALFVDRRGPYFDLVDECWDADRDATTYDGDHPAVMHPPCARWSVMAHLVEKWHGYPKREDGGLFESALRTLDRVGGVIEHPAKSMAWDEFGLPKPQGIGWWTGDMFKRYVSARVNQCNYGHAMLKPTWLLMRKSDPLPKLSKGIGTGRNFGPGYEWIPRERPVRKTTPISFAKLLISAAEACNADG